MFGSKCSLHDLKRIIIFSAAFDLLEITGLKKTDTQVVHILICSTDAERDAHGFTNISLWCLCGEYVIIAAGIGVIPQLKITGIGTQAAGGSKYPYKG